MSNKIMRDRISLDQLDRVVKEIVQTLLKILQTESCPAFYSDEFQQFQLLLEEAARRIECMWTLQDQFNQHRAEAEQQRLKHNREHNDGRVPALPSIGR
jgi:hypothetical protein